MIGDKMQSALNAQVNAELYSAYLYLAMSAHFQAQNLNGFAGWMRAQAQEELGHAMRIYGFLNERNGRVTLQEVKAPQSEWDSPLAAFEDVLQHEQHVTALIHKLVDLSMEERDHAANVFLQWFVTEQVEEEATANNLVNKLKMRSEEQHV